MDFTAQMTALLSELRRERNGEAADAMRFYGRGYGLNLGVALHTIRTIIADMPRNHDFAAYLYRQDVRELRIAALWLAEPAKVAPDTFGFWREGIINSEVAEQAAMALMSKIECADELTEQWGMSDDVLAVYTALLAAARNDACNGAAVLRAAESAALRFPDNRLAAQGAVAALSSLFARDEQAVRGTVARIAQESSPTANYIADEMSWRM